MPIDLTDLDLLFYGFCLWLILFICYILWLLTLTVFVSFWVSGQRNSIWGHVKIVNLRIWFCTYGLVIRCCKEFFHCQVLQNWGMMFLGCIQWQACYLCGLRIFHFPIFYSSHVSLGVKTRSVLFCEVFQKILYLNFLWDAALELQLNWLHQLIFAGLQSELRFAEYSPSAFHCPRRGALG